MTIKRMTSVIGFVLLLSTLALAQTQNSKSPSAPQNKPPKQKTASKSGSRVVMLVSANGVTPITVPNDEGAWVIQISTGGGFAGTLSESVTITSAGNFACDGAKSSTGAFLPSQLTALSSLIVNMRIHAVDQVSDLPTSLCSDCQTTSLTLSRRESGHKVKSYVAYWDPVTTANLPEELQQLHESVLKLSACERQGESSLNR